MTIDFLKKNLSFYDNTTICPYAVCDTSGTVKFNILEPGGDTYNMSCFSMVAKRPESKTIEVESITLDDFVEQQGLDRVDFIKADIEGAERLMLQGAQRTLARFAPRLALCTYHLPDDPEVMERLILQANPRYIIEHKWSKLYAYCP